MSNLKPIEPIFASDSNQTRLGNLRFAAPDYDPNHTQRRQQQRAISTVAIKVALLYGRKHFHKGAQVYTLGDRQLQHTPYARYRDALRGLRVVSRGPLASPEIITTCWHYQTRQRAGHPTLDA